MFEHGVRQGNQKRVIPWRSGVASHIYHDTINALIHYGIIMLGDLVSAVGGGGWGPESRAAQPRQPRHSATLTCNQATYYNTRHQHHNTPHRTTTITI